MIKYNNSDVNKWYDRGSELIKVYYHNAVCYYKITGGGDTPTAQTPCYAVVSDIAQYQDTEFEDVFETSSGKWYKLNNLNAYEEYGVYGSGRNITYYEGKLTIDDGYEYQYAGGSWVNVGETSGSTRVPAGYSEVEYVQNSSLAYINTGFKPNQDTRIVAKMQVVTSTSYNPHFGCGSWDAYNDIRMGYETGIGGTLHVKYGTNNGWTVYSNIKGDYSVHTYDWNKNEFYRDGTFIGSVTYGNFQSSYSLGIFYVIQNSSPISQYICYGRAYSFKIYDDGTLVRDLVPCIRKSDNIVGMYDVVNNIFYYPPNYSSSNYLIAGETIIPLYPLYYNEKADPPDNLSFSSMTEAEDYECPWYGMSADIDNVDYMFCEGNEWLTKYTYVEVTGDYICEDGDKYKKLQQYDRNADGTTSAHVPATYFIGDLIESDSPDCQGGLPAGYVQVEYISSENTSQTVIGPYIDTNFTPNQNTRVVLDYQPIVTNQNNRRIFGAGRFNNTSSGNLIWSMEGRFGQSSCKFYYKFDKGSSWLRTSIVPDVNRHVVDFNREGKIWIDDTAVVTLPNNTFTCSYNLGIFNEISTARTVENAKECLLGRVYSCQVYDNGILVRDLVPCKNPNNVVGMYDVVNNVFYTTGDSNYQFTAGPVVQ